MAFWWICLIPWFCSYSNISKPKVTNFAECKSVLVLSWTWWAVVEKNVETGLEKQSKIRNRCWHRRLCQHIPTHEIEETPGYSHEALHVSFSNSMVPCFQNKYVVHEETLLEKSVGQISWPHYNRPLGTPSIEYLRNSTGLTWKRTLKIIFDPVPVVGASSTYKQVSGRLLHTKLPYLKSLIIINIIYSPRLEV